MEHICKCNMCDNLFIDTNPQIKAPLIEVENLQLKTLVDHKCPDCKVDDYLTDDISKYLWQLLGHTFIDEDGNILESFLHFEIGTDREDIWHWFEETFNLSVAKDLMNL